MSDSWLARFRMTWLGVFGRRWGALVLVVLVAGVLRFDGLHWGDGTYPHPDERYLTMLASAVHSGTLAPSDRDESARAARLADCMTQFPATRGVGGWFSTQCSDFNPANVGFPGYPYGQLPLAMVRLAAEVAGDIAGRPELAQYGGIHLVGRAVSASADVLSLLVLFLLGRLLWGRAVGVLAASFYAVAVLPIQSAHFWTVDSTATLFAGLSLLFAVRIARFGHRGDAVAFGAACALAVACKISLLPLLGLLPIAAWSAPSRVAFAVAPDWLTRTFIRLPSLVLGGVAAFVTFRIASPCAFAGPAWYDLGLAQPFFDQILESRRLASGVVDMPPNWQWLDRTPWLWAARNLTIWGLGFALAIAAFVGVGRRGWRLLRLTPIERARAVAWCWVVGYAVWMGQQWVASMRYFLPVYPALCLFGAAWLVPWWRARRIEDVRCRRGGIPGHRINWPAATALAILAISALWALASHNVHTTLHPYAAATNWIIRNIQGPVSASISTAQRTPVLLNWPAAGEFGDDLPPRVAPATLAPASGTIDRLRLNEITVIRADPAPTIIVRILNGDGVAMAETAELPLAVDARHALSRDVELPLTAPLAVTGGLVYRLQIEVRHGTVTLAGSRIAHEGAWNDTVPTRAPRLAPADEIDLRGPSGQAPMSAATVDPVAEGYYVPIDLAMVVEDDDTKRERLIERIDKAEWIVIPNNRFYDSMVRNPLRFPLSIRFYDALFSGELGYSRHLVVASPPRIAGVSFDDQALPAPGHGVSEGRPGRAWAAEEAFSVYDHPTVHIFRRTDAYSRAGVERIFAPVNLTSVDAALRSEKPAGAGRLAWSTYEASRAPDGLMLAPNAGSASTDPIPPEVPRAADSTGGMLLAWYGFTLLLGWMAWPWLASIWPALPDRGYGVAKIAGLATVAVAAWWMSWLGLPAWAPRHVATILVVGLIATLPVARFALLRDRTWLRANWRYLLVSEGAFLALFALGLFLRGLDPDLWAPVLGGEKAMDYALFNSVLATTGFPPPDPWFSGGYLNYYYFGWVLVGVLTKLADIAPGVAYNLGLATWWALTGIGAFSLAWNISTEPTGIGARTRRRWIAGTVALVAAVMLGNLDLPRALDGNIKAVRALITQAEPTDAAAWQDALTQHSERWLWAPSRTVGERENSSHEINEFPAFSFLYGDLHPHLMAWPLQIFVLVALLALAMSMAKSIAGPRAGWAGLGAKLMMIALGVALLRATNTWDWPLYLLLAAMGAAIAGWRYSDALALPGAARTRSRYRVAVAGCFAVALFVAQAMIALPFSTTFVTGELSVRLFDGARTPLTAWFAMQGWFLLVIGGWAWLLSRESNALAPQAGMARLALRVLRTVRWTGIAGTAVSLVLIAYRGSGEVQAIGLQFAMVAWLVELLWRNARNFTASVGLLAAVVGLGIELAVEFVVLGQDIGRMNTYFKIHLQEWLLLSVAAGVATAGLVGYGVPRLRGKLYAGIVVVASLLALAYIPLATYGRHQTRFAPAMPMTLDGEAFLAEANHEYNGRRLSLADDQRLSAWLRDHAGRKDVILEAQLPEYRWGSRISTFTGRPTILGYRHHETQQRPLAELGKVIELRKQNIEALYRSTDTQAVLRVLRHYDVRYIVVGGLERAVYPVAGLDKFKAMIGNGALEAALTSGEDVIYRVIDTGAARTDGGARW